MAARGVNPAGRGAAQAGGMTRVAIRWIALLAIIFTVSRIALAERSVLH
jgi:hypothetical protein